ncbi:MAG: triose-phosphate isomerase [Anaerolineae bacterium]|nr:triose-phosphate isomerase [Thermoflexales bacterium]MDW8407561.1 triose-phosphate isomerase [Anaerolineae bacterium]
MRTPLIAGNWKMNKTIGEAQALIEELRSLLPANESVEIAVCPPYVALTAAKAALAGSSIKLGAQNAHPEPKGAFTGEVSVTMLAGLVDYVIIGHSERRQLFGESDVFVNAKVRAALAVGLNPILCIGETLAENEAGQTEAVLERQLRDDLVNVSAESAARVTIAYEPIWAIGTGRAATAADAQQRIAFIRAQLRQKYGAVADSIRIQYGGSVTPANAEEILSQPDIDGALVGGASLKAADFAAIVRAALK